jgi:hypothetical protein
VADLSQAYQRLDPAVLQRRAGIREAFAKALADWTAVAPTSSGVYGVLDVLQQVVAQVVAADNRVLLVVRGGMSWAVLHELLDDSRPEPWFEATLAESSQPPPVSATIPSITTLPRATPRSGNLTGGDPAVEKRHFEGSPVLRQCCDRRYPPRLFHKKQLTEGGRGAVADALSRAVLSQKHRVVGVVLNAIGDRLANPFAYLTQLQRHADQVAASPKVWLPWDYRAARTYARVLASPLGRGCDRRRTPAAASPPPEPECRGRSQP